MNAELSRRQNGPMTTLSTELAALAGLLADRTRAAICLALLDGRAWTAGELARHAGVAQSTASEHLTRLIAGGVLAEERQGRHRYVRLASPREAALVEDLAAYLAPVPAPTGSLKAVTAHTALTRARTCYDHLAGRLGVAITDAMTSAGYLDAGFALTAAGRDWMTGPVGVEPERLKPGRRPLARSCLDWTERRPHLAGLAGAVLCARFRDSGWIRPVGTGRAVRLTPTGQDALRRLLDVPVLD